MSSRRIFLKTAGVIAVGSAATVGATGCDTAERDASGTGGTPRATGFDRPLLNALAAAVLPESLGTNGIMAATDRFVAWIDGYEPVAEEMHGYGYADIRYLPADPAPAWRAQLAALDLLAQKMMRSGFAALSIDQRRTVLTAALRGVQTSRLPSPLAAPHVAVALLAHWSSSPDAWNQALGVAVTPASCRTLGDATRKPLPVVSPAPAPAAGSPRG